MLRCTVLGSRLSTAQGKGPTVKLSGYRHLQVPIDYSQCYLNGKGNHHEENDLYSNQKIWDIKPHPWYIRYSSILLTERKTESQQWEHLDISQKVNNYNLNLLSDSKNAKYPVIIVASPSHQGGGSLIAEPAGALALPVVMSVINRNDTSPSGMVHVGRALRGGGGRRDAERGRAGRRGGGLAAARGAGRPAAGARPALLAPAHRPLRRRRWSRLRDRQGRCRQG